MNKDNKKFIIETLFLKGTLKYDLTIEEFLVLMYFDNDQELTFDVKKIASALCLDEVKVLNAFSSLLDKNLITLTSVKNEGGKLVDKVSLDNLYNGIKSTQAEEKKKKDSDDFFNKFQEKYGHSLSGTDYELIKAWLDNGFSEELILGALDEAIFSGVVTLRYIDKILFEWDKNGFKTPEDYKKHLSSREKNKKEENDLFETTVLEFNWLDEED